MATTRLASYYPKNNCIGTRTRLNIELWLTPCIVTMPPPMATSLVVPSNERLCGTQFSHFPVGGPTPTDIPLIGEKATTTSRCQRTSDRILYACETVDGTITELVGPELQTMIRQQFPNLSTDGDNDYPIRCPTGSARRLSTVPKLLQQNFSSSLIFAVAPFYGHNNNNNYNWQTLLTDAYVSSFQFMKNHHHHHHHYGAAAGNDDDDDDDGVVVVDCLACPLLGAGTRGAPVDKAAHVAAHATRLYWQQQRSTNEKDDSSTSSSWKNVPENYVQTICFGVQDEDVAEALAFEFEEVFVRIDDDPANKNIL